MNRPTQDPVSIDCPEGKRVYFASDFHLGAPSHPGSLARERAVVRWLEQAERDASHIFLVGDLFDFWFEYKYVIPKGFVRLLGKLAEMVDNGIGVTVFTGNHDMWMDGYFQQELGIPVYEDPQVFVIRDKKFFIGHGDGLGPGDHRYKLMKKVFRSSVCRWLFAALHPRLGIALANSLSRKSRLMTAEETFLGEDKEWLVQFSREKLLEAHYDYFIFGHRHLPLKIVLPENSLYVNLGDWLSHYSYAVFDGHELALRYFGEGKPARAASRTAP